MDGIWRSDVIPEREQFASWRDACCRHVYAVTPERPARGPFRGRIVSRRFGAADVATLSCEGHRVERSREDIARAPTDTYYLYCQGAGTAWFRQRDRELVAESGDLVVADPDIPFITSASGDFDFRIWRVPRRILDPLLRTSGSLMMTQLSGCRGVGALAAGYLATLAGEFDHIEPGTEDAVMHNAMRLVALAIGATPDLREIGREALRRVRFERVRQHVEQHLAEPDLTPTRVAAALGMSVRQLHLLFEPEATSFARYVQRRRLEEIHARLTAPGSPARSITDLAFAWGFNDLSTFYRAFRNFYGAHPGEIRAAAHCDRAS
jgi:AraC-like DNA-binding protein